MKAVIHGLPQILLAAQVSVSRLHRRMPEKELNLLQLAATRMAEFRARSAKIVWCNALESGLLAAGLHHIPDHILADAFAPNLARPAHSPENPSFRDSSSRRPFIEYLLRPLRDRVGPNVTALADQVQFLVSALDGVCRLIFTAAKFKGNMSDLVRFLSLPLLQANAEVYSDW